MWKHTITEYLGLIPKNLRIYDVSIRKIEGINYIVNKLHAHGLSNESIMDLFDLIILRDDEGNIVFIIEIVSVDRETKELVTNTVFHMYEGEKEPDYSGHSYILQKAGVKY